MTGTVHGAIEPTGPDRPQNALRRRGIVPVSDHRPALDVWQVPRLHSRLRPVRPEGIESAVGRRGLRSPAPEGEAALAAGRGGGRAVGLLAAPTPGPGEGRA